jgi:hypothetical protein
MSKLYVISRETGEYSDYNMTPLFWVDGLEEAQAAQAALTRDLERIQSLAKSYPLARREFPVAILADALDKDIDGWGINDYPRYRIDEVKAYHR